MSDVSVDAEPFAFTAPLSVCVDVRHPQCYLALAPVRALAADLAVAVDWLPFTAEPMRPPPAAGDDRGARHRRARARYLEADIQRYAAVQGLTIRGVYRAPDATPAALGLLWLRGRAPEKAAVYLEQVFAAYWQQALAVEDATAIGKIVRGLGEDGGAFARYAAGPGPAELAGLRSRLVAAGVFAVPSLVVGGEVFLGRAHLPMARWLLNGKVGAPPI